MSAASLLNRCRAASGRLLLVSLCLALLRTPAAAAEPPSRQDIRKAKKLAYKARVLQRRGKWGEASALYAEAETLHPTWEYAAALAEGHLEGGTPEDAWEAVERAARHGVPERKQDDHAKLQEQARSAMLKEHAWLELEVVPPDARVRINGEQWRPPLKRWVKGSLSELSFEHGDYLPMNVNWHHPVGHTATKTVTMLPKTAYGRIEITGQPQGAIVTVDDRSLGTLPKARTGLMAPGSYKVRITSDKYVTQEQQITVEAGKTTEVTILLEETESDFVKLMKSRRFWGWTSVGVGAAAVAIGAGLLGHAGALREDALDLDRTHTSGYDDYLAQRNALGDENAAFLAGGGVMLGVGLALAGAGSALLIIDYGEEDAADTTANATWQLLPTAGGMGARVQF